MPDALPGEVARSVLREGVENRSPRQRLLLEQGVDYDVVGQCVGSGDLEELPDAVTVDGAEVTTGVLNCRPGLTTRNSAFVGSGTQGEVGLRFAEGVVPGVEGVAVVAPRE